MAFFTAIVGSQNHPPRLRARPPPTVPPAGNPLLRSKVTPASPSSDPRFPQLLSLELLPSFHFRAVPGQKPPLSRFPGPQSHFRGTLAVFTPPTCTSGPPLSPFLDALQAPKPTSGPPNPRWAPQDPQASPRFREGPFSLPGAGGGTQRPRPARAGPGPGPSGRSLPRAPRPSTPGPVLPRPSRHRQEQAQRGPKRGDDTTGLPGTFCSSSSPPSSPTPQYGPLPPSLPSRSALLPNYLVRPQSLRSGLGGAAVTSTRSPHPPRRRRRRRLLGSLQLSAEPQHRARRAPPPAPPLPARSNTLWELLFPLAPARWSVRGTGPAAYSGAITSPLPPQVSDQLPKRPQISSRSLRGTRKGTVGLRLVSLRRGHPLPSVVAGTNSPSGHPRPGRGNFTDQGSL
ncbi:uncharacterized protein [Marmota flaviventris]|uniref:uncharacterized protein n=1 Tax=Marmota flaviventris TaxID=93162 RepID=UPI003A84172C